MTVAGGKTNNNAAPGATNIGALVGIANAAAPSWTEGDQVLLSTDLAGNQRMNIAQIGGVNTQMIMLIRHISETYQSSV